MIVRGSTKGWLQVSGPLFIAFFFCACSVFGSNNSSSAIPVIKVQRGIPNAIGDPTPPSQSLLPKRFMVSWSDGPGIDGYFVLVVHPTQIFLRTLHNNPNPDSVYWVAAITSDQYSSLVLFLDAYRGAVLRSETEVTYPGYRLFELNDAVASLYYPGHAAGPRAIKAWEAQFDAAILKNLRRLIAELNQGIVFPIDKLKEDVSIFDLKHRIPIR